MGPLEDIESSPLPGPAPELLGTVGSPATPPKPVSRLDFPRVVSTLRGAFPDFGSEAILSSLTDFPLDLLGFPY